MLSALRYHWIAAKGYRLRAVARVGFTSRQDREPAPTPLDTGIQPNYSSPLVKAVPTH